MYAIHLNLALPSNNSSTSLSPFKNENVAVVQYLVNTNNQATKELAHICKDFAFNLDKNILFKTLFYAQIWKSHYRNMKNIRVRQKTLYIYYLKYLNTALNSASVCESCFSL